MAAAESEVVLLGGEPLPEHLVDIPEQFYYDLLESSEAAELRAEAELFRLQQGAFVDGDDDDSVVPPATSDDDLSQAMETSEEEEEFEDDDEDEDEGDDPEVAAQLVAQAHRPAGTLLSPDQAAVLRSIPLSKQHLPRTTEVVVGQDFLHQVDAYRAIPPKQNTGKRRASGPLPPRLPQTLSEEERVNVMQHIERVLNTPCSCAAGPCLVPLLPVMHDFLSWMACVSKKERLKIMHAQLLATCTFAVSEEAGSEAVGAPPGKRRRVAADSTMHAAAIVGDSAAPARMAAKSGAAAAERVRRVKPCYMLNGVKLCRPVFLAIFHVSTKSLRAIYDSVQANGFRPRLPDDDRRGKPSVGRKRARTDLAMRFLDFVAAEHGLVSPAARGATPTQPVILLPQGMPKRVVYMMYVRWLTSELINNPDKLRRFITETAFMRAWKKTRRFIRIATRITDYCDFCALTSGQHDVASQQALAAHRHFAHTLRAAYRTRVLASKQPDSGVLHMTMDFAERVYLPWEHCQVSQRFFVTGLKYDLFGISNDTHGSQVTYGLTEGHWPGQKTGTTVFSMVHHFLASAHATPHRVLQVNADNCSGQNKNRFMIWYFAWRVILRLTDEVQVSFLVAGHTKSLCDARFALIKRRLRSMEALTPAAMHVVVGTASPVMTHVGANAVTWCDWKTFLEELNGTKIPQLNSYHFFKFCAATPGLVLCGQHALQTEPLVAVRVFRDEQIARIVALGPAAAPLAGNIGLPDVRREYLQHNVVDAFFCNDDRRAAAGVFFDP